MISALTSRASRTSLARQSTLPDRSWRSSISGRRRASARHETAQAPAGPWLVGIDELLLVGARAPPSTAPAAAERGKDRRMPARLARLVVADDDGEARGEPQGLPRRAGRSPGRSPIRSARQPAAISLRSSACRRARASPADSTRLRCSGQITGASTSRTKCPRTVVLAGQCDRGRSRRRPVTGARRGRRDAPRARRARARPRSTPGATSPATVSRTMPFEPPPMPHGPARGPLRHAQPARAPRERRAMGSCQTAIDLSRTPTPSSRDARPGPHRAHPVSPKASGSGLPG